MPRKVFQEPKPKMVNHVALVVDRSGSMGPLARKVVQVFNEKIAELRKNSAESGQETLVTLVTFASQVHVAYRALPVDLVQGLTGYLPNGQTALIDGVLEAARELESHAWGAVGDHAFLVEVLTDGEENYSMKSTFEAQREIGRLTREGNWTFAFSVPRGSRRYIVEHFGAEAGNIQEWDQTEVGLERAMAASAVGTQNFYAARAAGVRSVNNYFTTDASKVTASKLRKKSSDVTSQFIKKTVEFETRIDSFCEAKFGGIYIPGAGRAFYQLMKKEKIQANKEVLLLDKTTKHLYDNGRELLGLPDFEVKVEPGNHANYDIFVQSTSPNRKLVRGTTVYYRK